MRRWNRVVRERTGVKYPDGLNSCRRVKRFREEKRERSPSDAEHAMRRVRTDGSITARSNGAGT